MSDYAQALLQSRVKLLADALDAGNPEAAATATQLIRSTHPELADQIVDGLWAQGMDNLLESLGVQQ